MQMTLALASAVALLACAASPAAVAPSRMVAEEVYASQETVDPYVGYAARSATFHTSLRGPRPAPEPRESAPAEAREIHYASEVGPLRAWYARPDGAAGLRVPVVVYLHNDFALRREAWENARPLVEAGYAVLIPGLRGEDGAAGERELLLGEVRDAK